MKPGLIESVQHNLSHQALRISSYPPLPDLIRKKNPQTKGKWEEEIFNRNRSGIDCNLDARNIKEDKDETNCKCNSGEEPEVLSLFVE